MHSEAHPKLNINEFNFNYPNPIVTMRRSTVYPDETLTVPSSKRAAAVTQDNEKGKATNSLHRSLKNILLLAQVFGLLPVMGVTKNSPKYLYFSWKTWKVIYCIIPCMGTGFVMLMLIFRMVKSGTDLYVISAFVFHACKMATTLSFFYLAIHWPNLMKEWVSVEVAMKSYGWPTKFTIRVKLISIIVLLFAAIQYVANLASNLVQSIKCKENSETVLEYFFTVITFPYVFSVLNYSVFNGLLLQTVDVLSSFAWSYVDLFIMIMSTALALRFKQVTARLKIIADSKNTTDNVWRNMREDYNRLCRLCKTLDNSISYIILMSFGSNLFFILIELFNSLRSMKNSVDKLYFFFSFGFLISRTIYVSLYAAWINDESKKPISILNSVSSAVYNIEIRRFIQQISFDSVALTGRNFFSVTRGLILSVAGAIVTYELVLIQFNENLLKQDNSKNSSNCAIRL